MNRPGDDVRYGIVVPQTLVTAVLRVSERVRRRLDIVVFLVDDFGGVREFDS